MKSKNCIIAFANSNGNYVNAMARLHESLRDNFNGDFMGFIGEPSINAPLHSEIPYAFKIHAFQMAIARGYTQVLYLDTSCFAVKNVQICFDEIKHYGFLFQDAGFTAAQYINDFSLDYFGVSRDEASHIKLVGNAGMLGLNFKNHLAVEFFNRWSKAMGAGCFNGKWTNNEFTESADPRCKGHRHDMVSGIILHQMGLMHLAKKPHEWLQYAGVFDEVANETIVFKARGM